MTSLSLFGALTDTNDYYGMRNRSHWTPPGGLIKGYRGQGRTHPAAGIFEEILLPWHRPQFYGREGAFRIPWSPEPALALIIDTKLLEACLYLDNRPTRIFQTVKLFAEQITKAHRELPEEFKLDLRFASHSRRRHEVLSPESRFHASISQVLRLLEALKRFSTRRAAKQAMRRLEEEPALFPEMDVEVEEAVEPYRYAEHFRNQLKARLLQHRVSTQVARESTLANVGPAAAKGPSSSDARRQSEIAWNLTTTTFYKSSGRPWKVAGIRPGVCYIGLVFKQDNRSPDPKTSCCAAQMFLDSGDGVVFKGAVGPWYSPDTGEYHLSRDAARDLVELAVRSYCERAEDGRPPAELFLHGKVGFNWEEWEGFKDAVDDSTNLVGVKIRDDGGFKLYRKSDTPVLRGVAYVRNDRAAFLWTRGWTPRLQTYPGREVPIPSLSTSCAERLPSRLFSPISSL